ncbi:MAG TPA: Ig-like domain-containing protein, partial [Patescibacteria group bacterium]|nr:Ig-like domain-containing protein [Patescibacteria group bacterium]
RDTDKDGLSDIDEIRYGTNPKSADSDLDGYIDGDEVENGFDPVKYSSGDLSDKIVFEDPKSAGEVKTETYVVEDVTIIDTKTGGKGLQLTGKGLPNSFVTIYIYSDPIVLTVKTDSDGNWTYELDKALDDGEHQVYVAVTDNTGKITAKSAPLAFVKTAEAATVIPVADAREEARTPSVAQNRSVKDFFFLAAIVIAALAVALATIGLIKHKSSTITPSTPSL